MRSFSCAGVFWSLLGYFAFRSDIAKSVEVCSDPIPSPRCNADSCLTHFPKTGCKARKPCGRISANMFAAEQLLRSTIGNVLAGGLLLWSTTGNVFVVKPTLRSNNDDKAAANAAVCPRCDIKIEYKRSFYLFFDNMLYYLRAQWLNMNNIIHTKPLFYPKFNNMI